MKHQLYKTLIQYCLIGGFLVTALAGSSQTINQSISLCKGDIFRGNKIESDTSFLIPNQNPALPDTLFSIHAIPPAMTFLNLVLCPGESFLGQQFGSDTTISRIYTNTTTGCDSIVYYVLNVKQNSSLVITGATAICKGASTTLSVGFYPAYTWSTGETIRQKEVTTSGTYTVSVTDVDGCTLTSSALVTVADPDLKFEALAPRCTGIADGMIDLLPENGVAPYTYTLNGLIQPEEGLYSGLQPGIYTAVVSDAIGCSDSKEIILAAPQPLQVTAPNDFVLPAGATAIQETELDGLASEITWSPANGLSCSDCLSPLFSPAATTRYIVTVKNSDGCIATDTVLVTVDKERKIYIPNVFQPEIGPFTVFSGAGVSEIESFHIYDRWGELVHAVKKQLPGDVNLAWNGEFQGKKLPSDVYLYVTEVRFGDGEKKAYRGDVLLIR